MTPSQESSKIALAVSDKVHRRLVQSRGRE